MRPFIIKLKKIVSFHTFIQKWIIESAGIQASSNLIVSYLSNLKYHWTDKKFSQNLTKIIYLFCVNHEYRRKRINSLMMTFRAMILSCGVHESLSSLISSDKAIHYPWLPYCLFNWPITHTFNYCRFIQSQFTSVGIVR